MVEPICADHLQLTGTIHSYYSLHLDSILVTEIKGKVKLLQFGFGGMQRRHKISVEDCALFCLCYFAQPAPCLAAIWGEYACESINASGDFFEQWAK